MPYLIDFDTTNRILRARFLGRVTDDDLRNMYRFGQENVARFDPLSGITDFSEATAVAFSPQTMRDSRPHQAHYAGSEPAGHLHRADT